MIKREFNPELHQDRELYREFLITGGWQQACPFLVELPYLNVPDTINNKLVRYYLRVPNTGS